MNRRKIGIAIVAGILGGTTVIFSARTLRNIRVPVPDAVSTPTPTPAELVLWEDPAGFTVKYPEGLILDINEDNDSVYAQVTLNNPEHAGSLTFWVMDPPKNKTGKAVQTPEEWAALTAEAADALILDTTLGGKPAKKLVVRTDPKEIRIGTLFEEVLFVVEGILTDEPYWQSVMDTVQNTFELIPLFTDESLDGGTQYIPVDEEELLE